MISQPSGGSFCPRRIFGISLKRIENGFSQGRRAIDEAEIERKRKQQENMQQRVGNSSKYVKRSEVERIREEEYLKRQAEKEKKQDHRIILEKFLPKTGNEYDPFETVQLDPAQITARLRKKGLPIRLFGETDQDRMNRLRQVQSQEEKLGHTPFSSFVDGATKGLAEDMVKDEATRVEEKYAVEINELSAIDTTGISIDLFKNDPEFCYSLVSTFWKRLQAEWGLYLQNRSDDEKQSREGKLQSAVHAQTIEHLRPLYKRFKKRDLKEDVMERIVDICYFVQLREYIKANDAYMKLSIGNAPWPVGVVNVGIHERKGGEKIKPNQVAHALNDEVTRKWIQGMKRLMNFAQVKYPATDPAKMMG
jgi:pre-mRNA-splicing factor 18